jgi:hypothetical protein
VVTSQEAVTNLTVESPQNFGESIPGVTNYEKGNSGEIGYYNIPRPIVGNWDAIVESALWLRGSASHLGQHSDQQSDSITILSDASDSSDEEDELESNSMDVTSSLSIHASESEEAEILIFDGEEYVPIEVPSTPPHYSTSLPIPTTTSPRVPSSAQANGPSLEGQEASGAI